MFLTAGFGARPGLKSSQARWGIYGPALVSLLAFLSRVLRLDSIKTLVFDETYYVKDAYALVKRGYEVQWPKDYDAAFVSGHFTLPVEGSFVVHPTVGKWLIGWGIEIFGNNPWGWRISTCLVGSACVFLLGRIVWHLFGNGKMATLASLLISLDGIQIVLSRTSILDIYLEFFILLGIVFLIRDQNDYRPKLLGALWIVSQTRETLKLEEKHAQQPVKPGENVGENVGEKPKADKDTPLLGKPQVTNLVSRKGLRERWRLCFGPLFWRRPWLLAAGIVWGLATGVKWSGLYVIAVFGIFVFIRELSARWATEPYWILSSILNGAIPAFINLVPVSFVVYLGSWIGWFTHAKAWGHTGDGIWLDWIKYHQQIFHFHTNLVSDHPYKSNPWGWLLQIRPTSFYYQKAAGDCGQDQCIQTVNSLGNPLLWWLGFISFLGVVVAAFVFLDWRAGLIVAGYFATLGPWLIYSNRTIFTFYTVVISPFVVLSLVYVLGILLGQWRIAADKNWTGRYNLVPLPFSPTVSGIAAAITVVVLILLTAVFFFPIWTGLTIPQSHFFWRMWLSSWI